MEKITIKNISSAKIVLTLPDIRFHRELLPGRVIGVSQEEYDELMFDSGFNGLIEDHYISVVGAEEEKQPIMANTNVYESKDIEKILNELDVTAFAKMIPTAAEAEKDTIAKLAIEKGITHPAFVKLIKQYCDVDVIAAINRKHQLEE